MRTFVFIITTLLSIFVGAQDGGKPGQRAKVADLSVQLPGTDTLASKTTEFFYAFEAGDQVMLDITMDNAAGATELVVYTHPSQAEVLRVRSLPSMSIQRFRIKERGIYRFTLTTKHATDQIALMKIWRTPESEATQEFNTNVVWKKIYSTVQVCEKQTYFVNSATKLAGNTRITLPVNLPPNTVEWYYQYTASRDREHIAHISGNASLLTELSAALFTGGASVLITGLGNMLSQPPGADYCDIHLLDEANYAPYIAQDHFVHVPDGTRLNFKSGNVRVTCCPSGRYFLGVRNNDTMHGIHVLLDVVAITAVEDWVMEGDR